MIRDAFDDQWRPVHFADDAAEIGEQVVAEFGLDQRPPLRRREDEMQQDVSRCMRHLLTPLRGLLFDCGAYPRLAAWAAFFRRFAAAVSNGDSVVSRAACLSEHTTSLALLRGRVSLPRRGIQRKLRNSFRHSSTDMAFTANAANIPILFRDAVERGDGHHKSQIVVSNQELGVVRS